MSSLYTRGKKLWCRLKMNGGWISRPTHFSVGEEAYALRYIETAQACLDKTNQLPVETSCIYAIQCENPGFALNEGPVKIGISTNPHARHATIQTSSPFPMHLLAWHPVMDAESFEHVLHMRCKPLRLRGEWFSWGPAIQIVVSEMVTTERAWKNDPLTNTKPLSPESDYLGERYLQAYRRDKGTTADLILGLFVHDIPISRQEIVEKLRRDSRTVDRALAGLFATQKLRWKDGWIRRSK